MGFLERSIIACTPSIASVGKFLVRIWVGCVFLFLSILIVSGLWTLDA